MDSRVEQFSGTTGQRTTVPDHAAHFRFGAGADEREPVQGVEVDGAFEGERDANALRGPTKLRPGHQPDLPRHKTGKRRGWNEQFGH